MKFGFVENDDFLSEIMEKMKEYDKKLIKIKKSNVNNDTGFVCKILRIKNG